MLKSSIIQLLKHKQLLILRKQNGFQKQNVTSDFNEKHIQKHTPTGISYHRVITMLNNKHPPNRDSSKSMATTLID